MIETFVSSVKWWISFSRKVLRITPRELSLSALFGLASQLFQMLSFLLPLKIILLAGSIDVPAYFPAFLIGFKRDTLILGLCISSVVLYLLHLISERQTYREIGAGARRLIASTRKLTLYPNQKAIAEAAYRQLSRAISSLTFVLVALTALLMIAPSVGSVTLGYLVFWGAIPWILSPQRPKKEADEYENDGSENSGSTRIYAAFGFLLVFTFIVYAVTWERQFSILTALIALLLARQIFSQVARATAACDAISRDKQRVTRLFFSNAIQAQPDISSGRLAALASPDQRAKWINEVLVNVLGRGLNEAAEISWYQASSGDLNCFHVTSIRGKPSAPSYLVKVFSPRRAGLAEREALLLRLQPHLPAARLLGATRVRGMCCHVFEVEGFGREPRALSRGSLIQFELDLASIKPLPTLIQLSERTHGRIWHRIAASDFARVSGFALGRQDTELVSGLVATFPRIVDRLKALPPMISIKSIPPIFLHRTPTGQQQLWHWGNWSVEPIGFGWPHGQSNAEQIKRLFSELKKLRPDLSATDWEDVELSVLMSAFERLCLSWRFSDALQIMPHILGLSNPNDSRT